MYVGDMFIIFDSFNDMARSFAKDLSMLMYVDDENVYDKSLNILKNFLGDDFSFDVRSVSIVKRENKDDSIYFKCNDSDDVERIKSTIEEYTYPKEENNWNIKISIGFESKERINSNALICFYNEYGIKKHPLVIGRYEERFGDESELLFSRNIHNDVDIKLLDLQSKLCNVSDNIIDINSGSTFNVQAVISTTSGIYILKSEEDLFYKEKWIDADGIGENLFLLKCQ